MASSPTRPHDVDLEVLRQMRHRFPSIDAALAEIARLSAELPLPKGPIHIISDVHGDDVKQRHVINNASGRLRPLVERLFRDRLPTEELERFIALIFYPLETIELFRSKHPSLEAQEKFFSEAMTNLLEIVVHLAAKLPLRRVDRVLPNAYRELLTELMHAFTAGNGCAAIAAAVASIAGEDHAAHLLRATVRVLRDLAVDELIIGGDCWDRGPRGDRVVNYLQRQPNISFIWGNHDAAWLGACLGQQALVAHVLRISCRYHRLRQLEEGYGISLLPLEQLANSVYQDDPAAQFQPRKQGQRDNQLVARMQKAAALIQFKLDGHTIERNPQFTLDHRRLLHHIDVAKGTITIDDVTYPLRDTHFPTLDPSEPYSLTAEEQACIDELTHSFTTSWTLWNQMCFLREHGWMYLVRDDNLIFHGCVPVEEDGSFQTFPVDGEPLAGRELFNALNRSVSRVVDAPTQPDLDLCWYLWSGPRSPLFGKDRICTLENDFVEDRATHVETKNPYFRLIHEVWFCDRVLEEFGVPTDRGLIVNGHVPVKIDEGESPLKRSGKAITIDGAFSEAYGDHGYTLLLEPQRTVLAEHHHFSSVQDAVRDGVDIVPAMEVIREWDPPRTVADTERGAEIRHQITLLEALVEAYRRNRIRPN
ncbi:Fructose-1,6-bisphosphatase class 3 [Planctomycetes bacterium Pan216]|uniref:Fructose-1,6-bisphosphatase class 3 n=1 Tax=Kolteria novifilia TaxID=2527975 RepID=A0A518AWY5_9BACT|nr:Fructose-1,6-bisphosphatase class 3 [Planctomycetes bacterium Pan216]